MTNIYRKQSGLLTGLLHKATGTEIGDKYNFGDINNYEGYRSRVPYHTYSNLHDSIERIKNGEVGILWPGKISNFAVSSGTTGKGKHLPLSAERLLSDRRFMRKIVFAYLREKASLSLLGPQLSLPGSMEFQPSRNIYLGEISGFLTRMIPFYLKPLQILSPSVMGSLNWEQKFNRGLHAALKKDLRVINAVPSWTLILFQKALEITRKKYISEIWPNLKLITGGGVSLQSYRDSLEILCGPLKPDFMEFYGSSEGYFAFSSPIKSGDLELVLDNGIFYEWIPYSSDYYLSNDSVSLPTWEVKTGTPYVITITNNSGLWRYPMNDIIEFTNLHPPTIRVIGRVSDMLDKYGEALHYHEAVEALDKALAKTGGAYHRFYIASVMNDAYSNPRHLWFVNWKTEPGAQSNLGTIIDQHICKINRHYAIRRESGALGEPEILSITDEVLRKWIGLQSFYTAQTKIPPILHDSKLAVQLLALMNKTT
jgi:hypothetical protein